jgi:putative endopeptidase
MRIKRLTVSVAAGVCALVLASVARATPPAGLDPANFDRSVRPQDDFFRYANGGWLDRTEIPSDKASWGSFNELDEASRHIVRSILEDPVAPGAKPDPDAAKLRTLYATFMDEKTANAAGIKPLAADFARIDALRSKSDVVAEFGRLDRFGANSPLDFAVHQDNRDSTRYIVDLVQSGLGLPDRDYYIKDDEKLKGFRAKYRDYVAAMLGKVGIADAQARATEILALETRIAEAQWTQVENRDPVKSYNKMAIADLAGTSRDIDWRRFLAAAGVGGKIKDLTVSQPSYVSKLGEIVRTTPVDTWKGYLKWRVLNHAAPYLSSDLVDTQFAFYGTTLRDVPVSEPRWKRAVRYTEAAMGEAVGRQYVERTFPPESKARVEKLVAELLATFRRSIDSLDWMGPETKAEAKAKLAAFTAKIGYPSSWRDYSKLKVVPGDLLGNARRATEFEVDRQIAKLGGPIRRDEWTMTPQTVNAYYNPELNEIVFPAAILQPPFFDAKADDAVNFGGIGVVIGHEISHGFDDQGSQFDGKGNLRDWWSAADHERFKAKTEALVAQYAAYEVVKGYPVNGRLTLGENIADNSGLAVAYKAYRNSLGGATAPVINGLTGDQRFFASYATIWRHKQRESESIRLTKIDPHSPAQFRVRGALANEDAYFRAFDVKPGDPLFVPEASRTRIW